MYQKLAWQVVVPLLVLRLVVFPPLSLAQVQGPDHHVMQPWLQAALQNQSGTVWANPNNGTFIVRAPVPGEANPGLGIWRSNVFRSNFVVEGGASGNPNGYIGHVVGAAGAQRTGWENIVVQAGGTILKMGAGALVLPNPAATACLDSRHPLYTSCVWQK